MPAEEFQTAVAVLPVELFDKIDILRLVVRRPYVEAEAVALHPLRAYLYYGFHRCIISGTGVGNHLDALDVA